MNTLLHYIFDFYEILPPPLDLKKWKLNTKNSRAFTLVEMLIVIVIIGILAAALIPRLTGIMEQAKRTKAKAEMRQIYMAIQLLENDTGVSLGGLPAGSCVGDEEIILSKDNCGGGLLCPETSVSFPERQPYTFSSRGGPYITEDGLKDGWGNYYVYDYDIVCGKGRPPQNPGRDPKKCGLHDLGPDETVVVAGIYSKGPDRSFTYHDNEIFVTCNPNNN